MVYVPVIFLSEWRELPSTPCVAGKHLVISRNSMLFKLRTSPDVLHVSVCKIKTLAIRHVRAPFPTTTIDSLLRHQKVGRVKDFSIAPRSKEEGNSKLA
jgi:hypothetical protein